MSKLVFTDKCPELVMVRFLNGSAYDVSKFKSPEGAWEEEKNRSWVREYKGHPDNAKQAFLNTLKVFTKRQLLEEVAQQIAQNQQPWAVEMGFIAEADEPEWQANQALVETVAPQGSNTSVCIEMPTYALPAARLLAQSTVIRDGVRQRVTLDELITGETVYPDPELKIPMPMVVIDNLSAFTADLPENAAEMLVQTSTPQYITTPHQSRFSDTIEVPTRGVAQRMVLHRNHGLSHQLLTTVAGGSPAWINVTGLSVQQPSISHENDMLNFALQFYVDFRSKMLVPAEVVNVKAEDFKEAKSHMGRLTRDYHACADHQEKKTWLLRAEKNLLQYRGYDSPRMKDRADNMNIYRDVMNKLIFQMGGCVADLMGPEPQQVKRSLKDLPPESRRLLNLNKANDSGSDFGM
ncbi:hypothetical protein JE959_000119 [Aeromonas veronii]|nr:hypothetical protein [Aeromonas veronii]